MAKKNGIVSQDITLFNDSIFNNLSFGLEDVSFKSLEEATKIAQAYEFISNLPKGFDTIIGDKGYRLSGGQKQRISIARATIKKTWNINFRWSDKCPWYKIRKRFTVIITG